MSPEWNFANVWETVAQNAPGNIAQRHGKRTITWGEFDTRANGIAWTLLQAGFGPQQKIALYLHNGPEYLQSAFACMKAALVPVRTSSISGQRTRSAAGCPRWRRGKWLWQLE